jgi:DNA-binding XRE family transcriptional regulator
MKITSGLSDDDILIELDARLAERRIRGGYSQFDLALAAGIAKRSVERCEAGRPVETSTLLRLMRALDGGASLDVLLPEVAAGGAGAPRRVRRRRSARTAGV